MDARQIASAVAKLQDSIQRYDTQLAKPEYLTRKVLVDPVLKILGWEIPTPHLSEVEYHYAGKRVDYALFIKDTSRPVCFIEAKRKDMDLGLDVRENEILRRHRHCTAWWSTQPTGYGEKGCLHRKTFQFQ